MPQKRLLLMVLVLALAGLTTSACGIKGPLTLPDENRPDREVAA